MDGELMSVYQFAKAAGRSPQWIYKQLKDGGDISRYVIHDDGKIRILRDGLSLYVDDTEEQAAVGDGAADVVQILKEQLQTMKEQLEAKDKQLEQLHEALQREQETVRAEQSLRIAIERRISLLEAPADDTVENVPPEAEKPSEGKIERSADEVAAKPVNQERRPGFFRRLFGR